MDTSSADTLLRLLEWIASVSRAIRRARPIRAWRNRRANALLEPLHHDVVHSTRRLAAALSLWDQQHDMAVQCGMEFCEAVARSMGALLALEPDRLHCCLKLITSVDGVQKVGTLARSRPSDNRPNESGPEHAHRVDLNTVWSALLGGSDG